MKPIGSKGNIKGTMKGTMKETKERREGRQVRQGETRRETRSHKSGTRQWQWAKSCVPRSSKPRIQVEDKCVTLWRQTSGRQPAKRFFSLEGKLKMVEILSKLKFCKIEVFLCCWFAQHVHVERVMQVSTLNFELNHMLVMLVHLPTSAAQPPSVYPRGLETFFVLQIFATCQAAVLLACASFLVASSFWFSLH